MTLGTIRDVMACSPFTTVLAEPIADDTLPAHRVALAGGFDLDHLGAHAAEDHRAERPGKDSGQINHAQSRQWQATSSHPPILLRRSALRNDSDALSLRAKRSNLVHHR
jgi:hypothetical protein